VQAIFSFTLIKSVLQSQSSRYPLIKRDYAQLRVQTFAIEQSENYQIIV